MTLEQTEQELDSGVEEIEPDLSLSDEVKVSLLKAIRAQAVVDYNRLKIQVRLNELVENTRVADQQREEAKKIIRQVNQLDKDIKQLS